MSLRHVAIAVMLCLGTVRAWAQESGDAVKGLAYAQRTCSGCHAIAASDTNSSIPAAPPFVTVANTRGMGATALAVWFRTPHPTMPNLIIEGEDMDDVIAYILSLKQAQ